MLSAGLQTIIWLAKRLGPALAIENLERMELAGNNLDKRVDVQAELQYMYRPPAN
jgi:hypothetical protein